jgi:hypothetical protein
MMLENVEMARKKERFFNASVAFLSSEDLREYLWYVIKTGEYRINAADIPGEQRETSGEYKMPAIWWFVLVLILLCVCMLLWRNTMLPMARQLT